MTQNNDWPGERRANRYFLNRYFIEPSVLFIYSFLPSFLSFFLFNSPTSMFFKVLFFQDIPPRFRRDFF